uniref:Phosphoprotein n=1 Tax=Ditylenchus dipsaci TaxID=166011 RepID=A0A915ERM4_9BILA
MPQNPDKMAKPEEQQAQRQVEEKGAEIFQPEESSITHINGSEDRKKNSRVDPQHILQDDTQPDGDHQSENGSIPTFSSQDNFLAVNSPVEPQIVLAPENLQHPERSQIHLPSPDVKTPRPNPHTKTLVQPTAAKPVKSLDAEKLKIGHKDIKNAITSEKVGKISLKDKDDQPTTLAGLINLFGGKHTPTKLPQVIAWIIKNIKCDTSGMVTIFENSEKKESPLQLASEVQKNSKNLLKITSKK